MEEEQEPCAYCGKFFKKSVMKHLPDEYPNWYCEKCYPDVLKEHNRLPWNRKRYT